MKRVDVIRNLNAMLKWIDSIGYFNEDWDEAGERAIAALNPWRSLDTEKPPKDGWYWVYRVWDDSDYPRFDEFEESDHYEKAAWIKSRFYCRGLPIKVSHWMHIVKRED